MIANSSPNGQPETAESPPEDAVQPLGHLYKTVYSTCYGLGYGVAFPIFLAGRYLPLDNAIGHGLCDGAAAASVASDTARAQLASTAEAVKNKAGDAYASVAQRVQEKVEAVQDAVATRRYRRREAIASKE